MVRHLVASSNQAVTPSSNLMDDLTRFISQSASSGHSSSNHSNNNRRGPTFVQQIRPPPAHQNGHQRTQLSVTYSAAVSMPSTQSQAHSHLTNLKSKLEQLHRKLDEIRMKRAELDHAEKLTHSEMKEVKSQMRSTYMSKNEWFDPGVMNNETDDRSTETINRSSVTYSVQTNRTLQQNSHSQVNTLNNLQNPTGPNAIQTRMQSRNKALNEIRFKQMPLMYETNADEIFKTKALKEGPCEVRFKLIGLNPLFDKSVNPDNERRRIVLRICCLKKMKAEFSDKISPKLMIKINQFEIQTGKPPDKGEKKEVEYIKAPIDITQYCHFNGMDNVVDLAWPDKAFVEDFGCGVFIGVMLPREDISIKLNNIRYKRKNEVTKDLVKNAIGSSGDICTESLKISLACPITKQRIALPAVGSKCQHVVCFDGLNFVEINRNKYTWRCPICQKPIGMDQLRVDDLLADIFKDVDGVYTHIEFDKDLGWKPYNTESVNDKKDNTAIPIQVGSPVSTSNCEIITLDSESEPEPETETNETPTKDSSSNVTSTFHANVNVVPAIVQAKPEDFDDISSDSTTTSSETSDDSSDSFTVNTNRKNMRTNSKMKKKARNVIYSSSSSSSSSDDEITPPIRGTKRKISG